MKKAILILTALALVIPAALLAQPCPADFPQGRGAGFGGGNCSVDGQHGFRGHRGGRGMKGGGMGAFMAFADELELTDGQKDELQTMRLKFQKEKIDQKAELKKAQVDLKALMRDGDASESAVLSQIDAVGDLKTDMRKMQYTHRNEMKAVLTEDQQNKIEELRKERREERRSGRGNKSGRGSKGRI